MGGCGKFFGRAACCALAVGLALVPSASAGTALSCSWSVSPSAAGGVALNGVDARTSQDVWAVGYRPPADSATGTPGRTSALHWNGSRWWAIPTPKVKGVLLAVSVVSEREAWAVGAQGAWGKTRALIEHWDGTRWRVFPSPNVGKSVLNDVEVTSPHNAWAVGNRASWETFGSIGSALIEHWDGKRWRVVVDADSKQKLNLNRMSITPNGEVWAVGETYALRGNRCVERWQGGRWHFVPFPHKYCSVGTVDAVDSHDVWIGGSRPLRWDGRHWHASRRLWEIWNCNSCGVPGLEAISERDVWVAGTCCDAEHGLSGVYIAHWDGAHWERAHAPFDRPFEDPSAGISDISAVSTRDVWAVGYEDGVALIEHHACSS